MVASPGYFDAMGMKIVAGRGITAADRADTRPVAVINQRMARKYFGDENPIGNRLKIEWHDKAAYEIVGIVNDVKRWSLADDQAQPETWFAYAQIRHPSMALAARGPGDPNALAEALRRAAVRVDPEQAVFDVATMGHILDESLQHRRLLMSLLAGFAAIALALAAVGLYGVLAVQVAQRTHELGIRMALGARPADVRALVVGQGLRLVVAGVVVGAACALALGGVLANLLYGVSRADPITFVAVGAALVAVALFATWLPARRATKIDPMIALRAS
jgi:putative ABC transport system permease protein